MFDTKAKLRAMGRMIARQAQKAAQTAPANDVISLAPLLRPWRRGAYHAGDVVVYADMPYRVVQAHDSTADGAWNPEEAPSLFALFHGTDAAHALPFKAEGHNPYMRGEYAAFDGRVYRCLADDTVHDPKSYTQAWEEVQA